MKEVHPPLSELTLVVCWERERQGGEYGIVWRLIKGYFC